MELPPLSPVDDGGGHWVLTLKGLGAVSGLACGTGLAGLGWGVGFTCETGLGGVYGFVGTKGFLAATGAEGGRGLDTECGSPWDGGFIGAMATAAGLGGADGFVVLGG